MQCCIYRWSYGLGSRSWAVPVTLWKIVRWQEELLNVNNTDCGLIGKPSMTLINSDFFCTESQCYIYGCNLQTVKIQNGVLLTLNLAENFCVLLSLWVFFFQSMCFIFLIAAIQLYAALKISSPLNSRSELTAGRTLAFWLSFNFGFRFFRKRCDCRYHLP